MTELPASDGGGGERAEGVAGVDQTVNERETNILDDDYDNRRREASPALDRCSSASVGSLSSESLPDALGLVHTWVHQQQMVDTHPHTYPSSEGQEGGGERRSHTIETLLPPNAPLRGNSSREAVQRGSGSQGSPDPTDGGPQTDTHATANGALTASFAQTRPLSGEQCKDEELASLESDVDESIEQLNQLILDLDPTFVPVPTRCTPLSRSTSLYANGISHSGSTHRSGWQSRQASDVADYPSLHSPDWGGAVTFKDSPVCHHEPPPSQRGALSGANSVDYSGRVSAPGSSDATPSTPAFPVSPPTPYVKSFMEFSYLRPSGQWELHGTPAYSRSFLDSMSHSTADGDLFRSEVSGTPPSCQRRLHDSLLSTSSESPLSHPDCSTPPPVWLERTPGSPDSSFLSRPSPPLALSSPNAHSSPRGPPRGLEPRAGRRDGNRDKGDLSSLALGNGSLERSLLEVVEGLGGLEFGLGLGEGGPLPLAAGRKREGGGGELHWQSGSRSPSLSGFSSPHSGSSISIPFPSAASTDSHRGASGTPSPGADLFASKHDTVKFVQDTSKFWYKPDISRDQAIAVLKDKEPGSFIVRDSHSFRGAYGLAMKVSTPPPSVVQQSKKVGDLSNELVRHFLIECSQKGVRLKGCPNEPYFGSLTALVCQHSITPLALPCKLIIPDGDPLEDMTDPSPQSASNSAAELLKQGAACNVWYLGSVELESLTGHQAVQKAASISLAMEPPPTSTVVHFKVSAQGITLTDNQRKLFFRRHYTVNMVIFCSLDPQDRRWTRDGSSSAKIFGFVARKAGSVTENVCHLFAEHDPEQPASAIVNFVSKVMIGSQKNK